MEMKKQNSHWLEKIENDFIGYVSTDTLWIKGDILIQTKKIEEAFVPLKSAFEKIKKDNKLEDPKNIRILEDYLFVVHSLKKNNPNSENEILELINQNKSPQRIIRLPSGSYRVENKILNQKTLNLHHIPIPFLKNVRLKLVQDIHSLVLLIKISS